jgi:hypothetical protein
MPLVLAARTELDREVPQPQNVWWLYWLHPQATLSLKAAYHQEKNTTRRRGFVFVVCAIVLLLVSYALEAAVRQGVLARCSIGCCRESVRATEDPRIGDPFTTLVQEGP